eukprot:TRINITY_DN2084_c0_g1_i16.p1 TRINITY_DN2084_c0_g1~~TRINITY_DN2084_c0_g1_i16.p1  ORF type:complete len:228 (-),score=52.86 TRINITY_DN2084_c0_g1_i16:289-972(-)
MDTSGLFSPQEAKKRVQTEINEILQCLENKKDEMFTEIETIEKEYLSKQQQKQKKINKINALIEQTEELADNSLTNVQNRIIEDLQNELSKASIQESDCSVEFEWGFSRGVISMINSIKLRRVDTRKEEDGNSPNLLNSPLARTYDGDTQGSILSEANSAGDSDLMREQSGLPEGSMGGIRTVRKRGARMGFRDKRWDGRSDVVTRTMISDKESVNSEEGSRRVWRT